jgi:hypothetical protein
VVVIFQSRKREATMRFQLFVTNNTGTRSYSVESLKEAKSQRQGWIELQTTSRVEIWEGDKELKNLRFVR